MGGRESQGQGHDGEAAQGEPASDALARFWSRALRDSPHLAFALDADRRIIGVSDVLSKRIGHPPRKMLGETCPRAAAGECEEACPFAPLAIDELARGAEIDCPLAGGCFHVAVTPFPDAAGEVAGVVYTAIEVSERRRVEDALRESEARYRAIVENAPIAIFNTTPEGKAIYMNPASARLFGYDSAAELTEAVNASSVQELLYTDTPRRKALVDEVHDSGGGWQEFHNVYRRKDGSLVEAQLHFCEREDLATGERSLHGFVRDVTAELESRRALESMTAILEEAEKLAAIGAWEWDLREGVIRVSKGWQEIHGFHRDVLSPGELWSMTHPDDLEAARFDTAMAASWTGSHRLQHRILRADTGEVRHIAITVEAVPGADGKARALRGAVQDITARVRADALLLDRESRLKRSLGGAVAALSSAVGMRDPYTVGHERRTAELACLIAGRLGWDDQAVATLRTAACIHDIGKVAVPSDILSKPGRLTLAERQLIEAHPTVAFDILSTIEFEEPIAEIVLQHHERMDGSGYPRGLAGEEILPEARVIGIADTVEAMVSHRPYRPALPLTAALEELEAGLGVRYDERAAAACLELMKDEDFLPFAVAGSD